MLLFLPISAQHLLFQFWGSEGQHSWPGGVSPSQLWWSLVYHHLLLVGFDFFPFHWMAHCSKSPGIEFLLKWFYMLYKTLWVCTESERTVRPWLRSRGLSSSLSRRLRPACASLGLQGDQALLPESDSVLFVSRCSLMCCLISLCEWRTVHPWGTLGCVLPVHSRSILLGYL